MTMGVVKITNGGKFRSFVSRVFSLSTIFLFEEKLDPLFLVWYERAIYAVVFVVNGMRWYAYIYCCWRSMVNEEALYRLLELSVYSTRLVYVCSKLSLYFKKPNITYVFPEWFNKDEIILRLLTFCLLCVTCDDYIPWFYFALTKLDQSFKLLFSYVDDRICYDVI